MSRIGDIADELTNYIKSYCGGKLAPGQSQFQEATSTSVELLNIGNVQLLKVLSGLMDFYSEFRSVRVHYGDSETYDIYVTKVK